jgi:putative salt-induced outer membrane protein YdiY
MKIRITDIFIESLLLLGWLIAQPALADVLILKNGDRITGDIKRIWDAEITIEPAYSDEFTVDVPAVDHIESDREFEIELKDGRELVGRFHGEDEQGNQIVSVGDETVSAPLADFFELDEPEDEFDWESNVEFSASLNSGNTDSNNAKLKADTTVKISDHRHIGEITFFREQFDGETTQDQELFKYDYNWLFRDPWFFSGKFSFERDPITQLEQRIIVSAGIGRDIWNTPSQQLSIQLGVGGQTEEIGQARTESSVATWSLRYRQDFFSDDLELYHNNTVTTNISGRTNTSYKTTTGLRYEINDLLYVNLSLDYDYETDRVETDPVDPPEKEDVALLVGVGLEFE